MSTVYVHVRRGFYDVVAQMLPVLLLVGGVNGRYFRDLTAHAYESPSRGRQRMSTRAVRCSWRPPESAAWPRVLSRVSDANHASYGHRGSWPPLDS